MLQAIDLIRVQVDALSIDDLQDHAASVLDTIEALNDYLNTVGPKSANNRLNGLTLAKKLRSHMSRVRDLINAHKGATVVLATEQTTGFAGLPRGVKPLGF
jgi:hypothetical protein